MTLQLGQVPQHVVSAVAGPWPAGDEDAMRRLGAAWIEIGDVITQVSRLTGAAHDKALAEISGAFGKILADHGVNLNSDLHVAAQLCYSLGEQLIRAALSTESSKYVIIGSMLALVGQLAVDIFLPGIGEVESAGATAATRLTVRAAVRELIAALGTDGARAAAARAGKTILFKGSTMGTVFGGAIPFGADTVQMTQGHRRWGDYDWDQIGAGALAGGVGGAAAEFVGSKIAVRSDSLGVKLGDKLGFKPAVSSFLGRATTRLAGAAVGGGGGAVAGAGATALWTHKFDLSWDNVMLGMVGGALGGMPHALRRPAVPATISHRAVTDSPPPAVPASVDVKDVPAPNHARTAADPAAMVGEVPPPNQSPIAADIPAAAKTPELDRRPAHPPQDRPTDGDPSALESGPDPIEGYTPHADPLSAESDRPEVESSGRVEPDQPSGNQPAGAYPVETRSGGAEVRSGEEPAELVPLPRQSPGGPDAGPPDMDDAADRQRSVGDSDPWQRSVSSPEPASEPSFDSGSPSEPRSVVPPLEVVDENGPAIEGSAADPSFGGHPPASDAEYPAPPYRDTSDTSLSRLVADYVNGNRDNVPAVELISETAAPTAGQPRRVEKLVVELPGTNPQKTRWVRRTEMWERQDAYDQKAVSVVATAVGMKKTPEVYIGDDGAVYTNFTPPRKGQTPDPGDLEPILTHLDTHDFNPGDVPALRERLTRLEPELTRLGRPEWYGRITDRLAAIEQRGRPTHTVDPEADARPAEPKSSVPPDHRSPAEGAETSVDNELPHRSTVHGEEIKPITEQQREALDDKRRRQSTQDWKENRQTRLAEQYNEIERELDGVNYGRAQPERVGEAAREGRVVAFEAPGPYLVDYPGGHITMDNLIAADRVVLENTAAMVRTLRAKYPDADIRVVSLWDDYNMQNPGTGAMREHAFTAEERANFRDGQIRILKECGLIDDAAVEGRDYHLFQESAMVAKAEELTNILDEQGLIRRHPGSTRIDDPENPHNTYYRSNSRISYVNYDPENALHFTFDLRKANGQWTCEALDFAKVVSLLETAGPNTAIVVPLAKYMRPQQDRLWELLRSYGVRPENYHNYFLDHEGSATRQATLIQAQFATTAAVILIFPASVAILNLDLRNERDATV